LVLVTAVTSAHFQWRPLLSEMMRPAQNTRAPLRGGAMAAENT
jgi:hypothetical protein